MKGLALYAGRTRAALAFLPLFLVSTGSMRAEPAAGPEREIRAVLKAQAAAWNRGEIDGYMNGYARGQATSFVSGDTLTRGWKTVRDRYARKYDNRAKMGTLSFTEVQITALGREAALVVGRWKLIRKSDKPHGRFTLLFRREREGWRIVHDHTSSAKP